MASGRPTIVKRRQAERHVDFDLRPGRPRCRRPPRSARTRACAACGAKRRAHGDLLEKLRRGRSAKTRSCRACGAGSAKLPSAADLEPYRTIFSRVPAAMALPRSLFKLLILATVVSNSSRDRGQRVAALDPVDDRAWLRAAARRASVAVPLSGRDASSAGAVALGARARAASPGRAG